MDESADARRTLTAVHQSDWKRPAGRPYTWLATVKNDLSYHNLSVEDATELALEVIDSKQSYALKWCKTNSDNDDDSEKELFNWQQNCRIYNGGNFIPLADHAST